jgi:hypothetical protein
MCAAEQFVEWFAERRICFVKKTELMDRRFTELLDLGDQVLATRRVPPRNVIGDNRVDLENSQMWATSASGLLESLFGRESECYQRFKEGFRLPGYESDMKRGLAVIKAAWNDYSKGRLQRASLDYSRSF